MEERMERMQRIRNPVIPGFYPDPSVCRAGEDYFLVTSSFGYFPGVPLFHSRDLVRYRQIGHCLSRDSQLPLANAGNPGGGIYAPTIRFHKGTFYMITTNVTDGGHFYVHTQDPYGDWSDPTWVDQGGIDPSILFDEDGTAYFTSTGVEKGVRGIYQSTIDIESGKRLTGPRLIWAGTGGQFPEAPHLFRMNGTYYLMIAEGGTEYGHMVTIARSPSPWGPFEECPRNPILSHRSTDRPIQATGHADMVQAHDGSWWMVFLAIRTHGYPQVHHLGRETFLAPVEWDREGWPAVGDRGRVDMESQTRCLPPRPWDEPAPRDDFQDGKLDLCWNFLKNPIPGSWSLTDRPGWLRLSCLPANLDGRESPAFVGRRQQHFACRASARMDFSPVAEGEEAGLTVFMNRRHHYEIAVARDGTGARDGIGRCILLRRRIGDLCAVTARTPISGGEIILEIRAETGRYSFSYRIGGSAPKLLGTGETRYLSTEVAGGFTGVYFAMYAASTKAALSTAAAYFDWFEYRPISIPRE